MSEEKSLAGHYTVSTMWRSEDGTVLPPGSTVYLSHNDAALLLEQKTAERVPPAAIDDGEDGGHEDVHIDLTKSDAPDGEHKE